MTSSFYDQLTCSICLELYSDPVRLHCFHVFCRKCIGDNLNRPHRNPACPECNAALGNNITADSLKKDFKLAALVQALKETPKCSEHNDGVDTLEECKADIMCRTCCKLLCVKCAFSDKHRNHDMDDLKSAVIKQKEYFAKKIPAVKRKLEDYTEQLGEIRKARKETFKCQLHCESDFNVMIQELEDRVKTLKNNGESAILANTNELCQGYKDKAIKIQRSLNYGKNLLKSQELVEKDPISTAKMMKEDAENWDDFYNPASTELPKTVTEADVVKNCQLIEENLLQLQKQVNDYLQKVRNGSLGKHKVDVNRGSLSFSPLLTNTGKSSMDQNQKVRRKGLNTFSKVVGMKKSATTTRLSTIPRPSSSTDSSRDRKRSSDSSKSSSVSSTNDLELMLFGSLDDYVSDSSDSPQTPVGLPNADRPASSITLSSASTQGSPASVSNSSADRLLGLFSTPRRVQSNSLANNNVASATNSQATTRVTPEPVPSGSGIQSCSDSKTENRSNDVSRGISFLIATQKFDTKEFGAFLLFFQTRKRMVIGRTLRNAKWTFIRQFVEEWKTLGNSAKEIYYHEAEDKGKYQSALQEYTQFFK